MKPGNTDIIIIADIESGKLQPVTYELLSAARALSGSASLSARILITGENIHIPSIDLAGRTGLNILAIENAHLSDYNGEVYLTVIGEIIREISPRYIICAHTSRGSDLAPGLAVRLGAGCVSSVEKIRTVDEKPVLTRALFGGKLMIDVFPGEGMQVFTIMPGAFTSPEETAPVEGSVEVLKNLYSPKSIHSRGKTRAVEEGAPITEADVIVSAGRGIRKPENLELVRRLAGLFSRSTVGGSRSVCDMGWLEYSRQIGITGKTVAPKLYIACGISGASQHVAGMKDSQLVVAINSDPNAAIFSIADYGIVEDLSTFIPLLLEEYEKIKT